MVTFTARDRITAALEHRTLDRIPLCDTAYWPETIARWESEGLPRGVDPIEYFEMDRLCPVGGFRTDFFPHEIYEDTDEYCVDLNGEGTVVKWYKNRGSSSGHLELEHRVQTIDDWRAAREQLTVTEERLSAYMSPPAGAFPYLGVVDHFWMSFRMLGMENLCCWLAGEPDEMREIYQDYTDFLLGMLDLYVAQERDFLAVWFFSDMAFHSGPMFSAATYREVIAPSYDRLRRWCTDHGKWLFLHCDGNLDVLLPEFIRSGFDVIHPLEARAGNDVRRLKEHYGDRITLVGNINADVLARGDRREIEEEIAGKIPAARERGGYIYHIDHSVPPTIAFDTYSFAIELLKHYGRY